MSRRFAGSGSEVAAYLKELTRSGYVISRSKRGCHWKIWLDGRLVGVHSSSGSDVRGLKNLRSDIRRRTEEIRNELQREKAAVT
jgi:hypothetical protein